jgi:L-threonylcarbamoyladenylate synthase
VQTEIVHVNPEKPQPEAIGRAAAVLRGGGLVAFPTETVYGLGANALNAAASARIFVAKGRPPNNPVIVHVPGPDEAKRVVAVWPATAARLAERFWPGSLTLVLPKSDIVADIVTAGGPTVAVRVPAHPVALALLHASGVPVAAPSANLAGQLSPTRAEHVLRGLAGRIDMILDGGPAAGGLESTVLDLSRSPPRLLRPGLIMPADIEAIIGPIERSPAGVPPGEQVLPSPGMLARHYAPRAPLECVAGDNEASVEALARRGIRVGWVRWGGSETDQPQLPGVSIVVMPSEPAAYAAQLYAVLHMLDDSGVQRIVAELPPDAEEWLTVRDRLRRASAV